MEAITKGTSGSHGQVASNLRAVIPPVEFRAFSICGDLYGVDAPQQCAGCGRYECTQHACKCNEPIDGSAAA